MLLFIMLDRLYTNTPTLVHHSNFFYILQHINPQYFHSPSFSLSFYIFLFLTHFSSYFFLKAFLSTMPKGHVKQRSYLFSFIHSHLSFSICFPTVISKWKAIKVCRFKIKEEEINTKKKDTSFLCFLSP